MKHGIINRLKRLFSRSPRVVPITLRKFSFASNSAEYLHQVYFMYNKILLTKLIKNSPSLSSSRQYKKYLSCYINRVFFWYFRDVFLTGLIMCIRNSRYVKNEFGKGFFCQLFEMYYYSLYLPSMPENYYKFRWYRQEKRGFAKEYVHRYEMKNVLYPLMYSLKDLTDCKKISNKYLWYMHACEHNIPVIPLFGLIDKGSSVLFNQESLGTSAYFIKPAIDKGGKDIDCLVRVDGRNTNNLYTSIKTGLTASFEEFISLFRKKAEKKTGGYLLQPRIENHNMLKEISGATLVTVRIITILNEKSGPEIVSSHFRFSSNGESIVDNMHAGGLACAVDLDNGTLGKIMSYGIDGSNPHLSHHPASKKIVEGVSIPYWMEIKKLAVLAHKTVIPIKLVGWDICITNEGPLVVEANIQPCTDGPQRRLDNHLGTQRFGNLIAYHIKKNLEYDKKKNDFLKIPDEWKQREIDNYLDLFIHES